MSTAKARRSVFIHDEVEEYIGNFFEDDLPHGRKDSEESIAASRRSGTESEDEEKAEAERQRMIAEIRLGNKIQAPIEWYSPRLINPNLRFDLELWWRRSDTETRSAVVLIVLLIAIVIAHLGMGIGMIIAHYFMKVGSPFVCEAETCKVAAELIAGAMDTHVEPCDNIYKFVCGNYKEKKRDEVSFADLVHLPDFKLELGTETSFLAKILKHYENDEEPVKFYKACIGQQAIPLPGIDAFYDKVEEIFGTRDFKTFENSTISLEEIGANMLRTMGQAVFVNLAFSSYPFIQFIRPDILVSTENSSFGPLYTLTPEAKFTYNLMQLVNPKLGVPKEGLLATEIMFSIQSFRNLIQKIEEETLNWKSEDLDLHLENDFSQELSKSCPPLGVQFNITKMLDLFLKENFKEDYLDLWTKKYIKVLQKCFSKDPSNFQIVQMTYPRTAFTGVWIFGLFYEFMPAMKSETLVKLSEDITDGYEKYGHSQEVKYILWNFDPEARCLHSMFYFFGYRTSLKLISEHALDPQNYIYDWKATIEKLYEEVRTVFWNIPETEISHKQACAIQDIFLRDFHTDVVMPLVGGILDDSVDSLNFTDCHLCNTFKAVGYTIEKARSYWIGSTDVTPVMKWWAHGSYLVQGDHSCARARIFSLNKPMILSARLDDTNSQNRHKFRTFLGRNLPNYVLFPILVTQEPHHNQTLAIHVGSVTVRLIRAIFGLAEEVIPHVSYDMFNLSQITTDTLKVEPSLGEIRNRNCSVLKSFNLGGDLRQSGLYQRQLVESNLINYTWNGHTSFLSLVALKEAYRHYREETEKLKQTPYIWSLPEQTRIYKKQRILPGRVMGKFNEDQLFFLSFVRHTCRERFELKESYRKERYELEATVLSLLMQMEEFSDAFKCPKKSFMNNNGNERCFQYNPISSNKAPGITCSNLKR